MPRPANTVERLMRKVCRVNDCWELRTSLSHNGYPQISVQDRLVRASRFFYTSVNGEIPDDKVIDHLCRNRLCVNPDHLEIVSPAENVRRGKIAKLTHEQIEEIRHLKGQMPQRVIAGLYNVNQCNISRILNNKRWSYDGT